MLKLEIRGMTIPYSVFKKRERDKKEKDLEDDIKTLLERLDSTPSEKIKEDLLNKKNELEQIREAKIRGLIMRTKAQWAAYGEKNSKYFCNLEKRHYTEKLIPKLVLSDNKDIYDQKEIIKETENFYKDLYKRKIEKDDKDKFERFTAEIATFSGKLNELEKRQCEGRITLYEMTQALKEMENGKSPGIDGFTVEFYKFFWSDLGAFLLRAINFSYDIGSMSVSQRQSMITLIPCKKLF